MKSLASSLLILTSALFLSSCRKSDRDADTGTIGVHDAVLSQSLVSDLLFLAQDMALSDTLLSTGGGNYAAPTCLNLSHSPATGGFPLTVSYNFGNGCTCSDGRYRSGQLTAEYSGYYGDSLTDITFRFQNYHCNNVWYRQGSITWKCLGTIGSQNKSYELIVSHMQFLGDSVNILFDANQNWEQTAGSGTPGISDDVYTTTGKTSGHHTKGNYFETSTDSSGIICSPSCTWPYGGNLTVRPANLATRNLVFGTSCNHSAAATINGVEYMVELPELQGN